MSKSTVHAFPKNRVQNTLIFTFIFENISDLHSHLQCTNIVLQCQDLMWNACRPYAVFGNNLGHPLFT